MSSPDPTSTIPTPPHPSSAAADGPVERAFRVLRCVAAADGPVGVREVGRRTGLPRSTAARLVTQLVDLGMLARHSAGEVSVGPAVATLQPTGSLPQPGLEDRLRPLLHELVDRFGESAALTVDTPGGALYLSQVPAPSAVQVPDATGEQLPFHLVAPGLALMASWPADRLEHHLAEPLESATEYSLTEPGAVRQRLAMARSDGYVWTEQEYDLEVNGLAVAIDDGRTVVGAVSLYGPAYRLAPAVRAELGRTVAVLVRERAMVLLGTAPAA